MQSKTNSYLNRRCWIPVAILDTSYILELEYICMQLNWLQDKERKGKIFYPVLWQKSPLHQKMKAKRQHDDATKTSITQQNHYGRTLDAQME